MLKPSIDLRERWIRNPYDLGYSTDNERIRRKVTQRAEEWQEMSQFLVTNECLMLYIRRALGDLSDVDPCGKCSSCITTEFTFDEPEEEQMQKATDYVKNADIDLVCKKQVRVDLTHAAKLQKVTFRPLTTARLFRLFGSCVRTPMNSCDLACAAICRSATF